MKHNHRMDIAALFAAAAEPDPTRPFITYYDDATGERTELSYATLGNWVAKTANLLTDAHDPGDEAAVVMPPHWLTAAIMLGCWSAGLGLRHRPGHDSTTALAPGSAVFYPESGWPVPDELRKLDAYVVNLAPLATRMRDDAATKTATDYLTEVRGQGDQFAPIEPLTGDEPALTGLPAGASRTQAEVVTAARERATALDITGSPRLLFAGDRIPPLDWLLVPLVVKGSVVLVRNSDEDLAARAGTEHASVITP